MAYSVSGKVNFDVWKEKVRNKSQIPLYCDPCEEDGKQAEAKGFCVECQHYLCDNCYKCHCVPKPTRHHCLLDNTDMPKRKVESGYAELCATHDGAANKYYCTAHEAPGCISCMDTDHTSCEDIVILEDIAKDFEDSHLVKDFMTMVDEAENEFHDYDILTQYDNIQASKRSAEKAISDINKYQKKVIDKFDHLKQNILKEATNIEQEYVQKVRKLHHKMKTAGEVLVQVKSDLKILQTSKQSKQLFIAMKEAKLKKSKFDKKLTDLKENDNVRKYVFVENELLNNMLSNIDQIGELLIQDDSDTQPISSFSNYSDYGISKGIYISETRYVSADHIHNSLELFEYGETVLKHHLSSGPWDIVCTGKNRFAVTLPSERTIKVMLVSDSEIIELATLSVSGRCEGIAYGHGYLFVTCTQPAEVQALSVDGEVRQSLTKEQCPTFKQPAYIAYNHKNRLLCVTDRQTTTIHVIDTCSLQITEYKTNEQVLYSKFKDDENILLFDQRRHLKFVINLPSETIREENQWNQRKQHVPRSSLVFNVNRKLPPGGRFRFCCSKKQIGFNLLCTSHRRY